MSFWLKVCIYSHTRGVQLGLGLGFMQTSQVVPHWLNQLTVVAASFLVLLEVDGKTVVVSKVDVVGKCVVFWVVVIGISDVVAASLFVLVEADG